MTLSSGYGNRRAVDRFSRQSRVTDGGTGWSKTVPSIGASKLSDLFEGVARTTVYRDYRSIANKTTGYFKAEKLDVISFETAKSKPFEISNQSHITKLQGIEKDLKSKLGVLEGTDSPKISVKQHGADSVATAAVPPSSNDDKKADLDVTMDVAGSKKTFKFHYDRGDQAILGKDESSWSAAAQTFEYIDPTGLTGSSARYRLRDHLNRVNASKFKASMLEYYLDKKFDGKTVKLEVEGANFTAHSLEGTDKKSQNMDKKGWGESIWESTPISKETYKDNKSDTLYQIIAHNKNQFARLRSVNLNLGDDAKVTLNINEEAQLEKDTGLDKLDKDITQIHHIIEALNQINELGLDGVTFEIDGASLQAKIGAKTINICDVTAGPPATIDINKLGELKENLQKVDKKNVRKVEYKEGNSWNTADPTARKDKIDAVFQVDIDEAEKIDTIKLTTVMREQFNKNESDETYKSICSQLFKDIDLSEDNKEIFKGKNLPLDESKSIEENFKSITQPKNQLCFLLACVQIKHNSNKLNAADITALKQLKIVLESTQESGLKSFEKGLTTNEGDPNGNICLGFINHALVSASTHFNPAYTGSMSFTKTTELSFGNHTLQFKTQTDKDSVGKVINTTGKATSPSAAKAETVTFKEASDTLTTMRSMKADFKAGPKFQQQYAPLLEKIEKGGEKELDAAEMALYKKLLYLESYYKDSADALMGIPGLPSAKDQGGFDEIAGRCIGERNDDFKRLKKVSLENEKNRNTVLNIDDYIVDALSGNSSGVLALKALAEADISTYKTKHIGGDGTPTYEDVQEAIKKELKEPLQKPGVLDEFGEPKKPEGESLGDFASIIVSDWHSIKKEHLQEVIERLITDYSHEGGSKLFSLQALVDKAVDDEDAKIGDDETVTYGELKAAINDALKARFGKEGFKNITGNKMCDLYKKQHLNSITSQLEHLDVSGVKTDDCKIEENKTDGTYTMAGEEFFVGEKFVFNSDRRINTVSGFHQKYSAGELGELPYERLKQAIVAGNLDEFGINLTHISTACIDQAITEVVEEQIIEKYDSGEKDKDGLIATVRSMFDNQTSTSIKPKIEDKIKQFAERYIKIKKARDMPLGLPNLGGTCWLNSTLQMMAEHPGVQGKFDHEVVSNLSEYRAAFEIVKGWGDNFKETVPTEGLYKPPSVQEAITQIKENELQKYIKEVDGKDVIDLSKLNIEVKEESGALTFVLTDKEGYSIEGELKACLESNLKVFINTKRAEFNKGKKKGSQNFNDKSAVDKIQKQIIAEIKENETCALAGFDHFSSVKKVQDEFKALVKKRLYDEDTEQFVAVHKVRSRVRNNFKPVDKRFIEQKWGQLADIGELKRKALLYGMYRIFRGDMTQDTGEREAGGSYVDRETMSEFHKLMMDQYEMEVKKDDAGMPMSNQDGRQKDAPQSLDSLCPFLVPGIQLVDIRKYENSGGGGGGGESKTTTVQQMLNVEVVKKENATIQDCVDEFSKAEDFQDAEKFRSEYSEWTTKQMQVGPSPPENIQIQLKRFERDMTGRVTRKDLTSIEINREVKIGDARYEPVSVVCHSGGTESGHYITYTKIGEKWYKFDDHEVNEEKDVDKMFGMFKEHAYLIRMQKVEEAGAGDDSASDSDTEGDE